MLCCELATTLRMLRLPTSFLQMLRCGVGIFPVHSTDLMAFGTPPQSPSYSPLPSPTPSRPSSPSITLSSASSSAQAQAHKPSPQTSQVRRLPEAQGPRACTKPGASSLEALGTEEDIGFFHLIDVLGVPMKRAYQVWRQCNHDSGAAFELLLAEADPAS